MVQELVWHKSASGTLHSIPGVVLSVGTVVPLLMEQKYFGSDRSSVSEVLWRLLAYIPQALCEEKSLGPNGHADRYTQTHSPDFFI